MPLTSSMEDYLEAVLVLQQQKGYVRCVDVAELLDVKKPSVSRAVKELSKKKCLIKAGCAENQPQPCPCLGAHQHRADCNGNHHQRNI